MATTCPANPPPPDEAYVGLTKGRRSTNRVVCATCGKSFHPLPTSAGKYCSTVCRSGFVRMGPEPPPVDGARWIALGNGRFSLVDVEDYVRASAHCWSDDGRAGSKTFYAKDGTKERVRLHHFILGLPGSFIIDHKDGNETNNRRGNLRVATAMQNTQNRAKRAWKSGVTPKSKFKGVWAWEGGRKWTAVITAAKKRRYLGIFETQEEAARAHDDAARRLHGEFACVNFPLPGERGAVRCLAQ